MIASAPPGGTFGTRSSWMTAQSTAGAVFSILASLAYDVLF
jgi:hypothetical protein